MSFEVEAESLRKKGVRTEIVRTFNEMDEWTDLFVNGRGGHKLQTMIIVGNPGTSKSHRFESAGLTILKGDMSPIGLYEEAYIHRDEPLVIDDIDDALKNKDMVRILKTLLDTKRPNTLGWHKQNAQLLKMGIPKSFETKSQVCIISNDLASINRNFSALLDRIESGVIFFQPTASEVHQYVSTWFDMKKYKAVFDFIGENLHQIHTPSCRLYVSAAKNSILNENWKQSLITLWTEGGRDKLLSIIGEIMREAIPAGGKRESEFAKRTGLCRSYFYRLAKEYQTIHGA